MTHEAVMGFKLIQDDIRFLSGNNSELYISQPGSHRITYRCKSFGINNDSVESSDGFQELAQSWPQSYVHIVVLSVFFDRHSKIAGREYLKLAG